MSPKDDLRAFLVTRRARVTPEAAGLSTYGRNRRVAGLRREEVAALAGISVEYYTRLERGNAGAVSAAVLDGLASALQLDAPEREHLERLVRTVAAGSSRRRGLRRPMRPVVRPTVQRILDVMPVPAYVRNGRFDVLATNRIGRALYAPVLDSPVQQGVPNSARFVFLDPAAADFFPEWERVSDDAVAYLRAEAGRDPYGMALQELVGELSLRSDRFRERWAAHDVRHHRSGTKLLHHPVAGALELDFEAFDLPGDDGLRLSVYTAAPDTPSAERLALLASWTAPAPVRG